MLVNFGKGKHIGRGNLDVNNNIGDTALDSTVKEKGCWGVKISVDMNV